MTTQPPSHEEVQRVLDICSVRALSCMDPLTGKWINVNAMLESLLADKVRKDERIAALEAALNAIKDCAGEDGESVFDAFTIRSVCRAALNPAGQCSGTATGREGSP